jgi:hypothetical protein
VEHVLDLVLGAFVEVPSLVLGAFVEVAGLVLRVPEDILGVVQQLGSLRLQLISESMCAPCGPVVTAADRRIIRVRS